MGSANRTLGAVSKMMTLAEAWSLRPERANPCYDMRKYRDKKRERCLTADELARLGRRWTKGNPSRIRR